MTLKRQTKDIQPYKITWTDVLSYTKLTLEQFITKYNIKSHNELTSTFLKKFSATCPPKVMTDKYFGEKFNSSEILVVDETENPKMVVSETEEEKEESKRGRPKLSEEEKKLAHEKKMQLQRERRARSRTNGTTVEKS